MIEGIRKFIGSVTPTGWLLGGGILLAMIAFAVAVRSANDILDDTRDTAREAGESGAVAAGQEQTLKQVKEANDAQQDLRAGGERSVTRYNDCLRDNRRPETCDRFRPVAQQPVPD